MKRFYYHYQLKRIIDERLLNFVADFIDGVCILIAGYIFLGLRLKILRLLYAVYVNAHLL